VSYEVLVVCIVLTEAGGIRLGAENLALAKTLLTAQLKVPMESERSREGPK
jgi:hypothetical protein